MDQRKDGAQAIGGRVYLVGAGPGDPDLLTVKAERLIARAALILHDDLVPPAILALASAGAEIVSVGKRFGAKGPTQAEINDRMISAARRGLDVVRLKGGDPAIFGRLAEEIDALEAGGVPFEIVPGITAGLAAAASLGVSLTDRRKATRVIVVTNHQAQAGASPDAPDWRGLVRDDSTLVIYMPGHDFAGLRRQLLGAGCAPDTPAALVSSASVPEERYRVTTTGELDSLPRMDSPTVLLIGPTLDRVRTCASEALLPFEQAEWLLCSLQA